MSFIANVARFLGYGRATKSEYSEAFISGVRFAQETGLREAQKTGTATMDNIEGDQLKPKYRYHWKEKEWLPLYVIPPNLARNLETSRIMIGARVDRVRGTYRPTPVWPTSKP